MSSLYKDHKINIQWSRSFLSGHFISETTHRISIKFGIGRAHYTVSNKFYFDSYLSNTTSILYEAQLEFH